MNRALLAEVQGQPAFESLEPRLLLSGGLYLEDLLTDGTTVGNRENGTFILDEGWQHETGHDKIWYDIGQDLTAGVVEFNSTNWSNTTGGGTGDGKAYFFGLYDDEFGDKTSDYTGCAFIELRWNTASQDKYPLAIKVQAGNGSGQMSEIATRAFDWDPDHVYDMKIEFGNGQAKFYMDDVLEQTATYSGSVNWRYLYIGDINYKETTNPGMYPGPDYITYSDVYVTDDGKELIDHGCV